MLTVKAVINITQLKSKFIFVVLAEKIPSPMQVNKQQINVEKGAANQPYLGINIKFKKILSIDEKKLIKNIFLVFSCIPKAIEKKG